MAKYYLGFDLGSDSIHAIALNNEGKLEHAFPSFSHFGNPVDTLREVYGFVINILGEKNIGSTAFTGSFGESVARRLNAPFYHDTITIPKGMDIVCPDANYIFHIGSRDSYFFEREIFDKKGFFTPDHGTGTKCGGGSGILITKQFRRFFEHEFPLDKIEAKNKREVLQKQLGLIFKRAKKEMSLSDKDIDVGGRCGVVIQSDMIHLQNSGEQIKNILNGMMARVAKNYKTDVMRTRMLNKNMKATATGGVFKNRLISIFLEKELGLKIDVPVHHEKVAAVGAALKAFEEGKGKNDFRKFELSGIAEEEKTSIKTAPALSSALDKVKIYEEKNTPTKKGEFLIYQMPEVPIDVIIGLDGGSTTTKVIILKNNDLSIVAEICVYTNGQPLAAAQSIFRQARENLGDKINIKGVSYTGSSGAFYHKLFTDFKKEPEKICIDIIKDEITCHAVGVKHFNEKVDTIFELGGQDAKFTLFNPDGTVKKSKMNLSCMAGTGQTMQNMVEMIGLDIKNSFHEYALRAKRTPIVDETCGVFTEAGIAKLIALDFPKEEIAAAIAYGFMGGYINKFVGKEKFGKFASAQGGPFNGIACLAALALHTGMEIHAFPHRQIFGAFGAALCLKDELEILQKKGEVFASKFRGFKISEMKFEKITGNCSEVIEDSCGLRDCKLQAYIIDNDRVLTGGLCPKGNTESVKQKTPDYVSVYKTMLNKRLAEFTVDIDKKTNKERVLIPRALTFLNEKGIFYAVLFRDLGFEVAVSPESDDEISGLGTLNSHSEMCFPVKLAHGHAAFLKKRFRPGKDKFFLVNAVGTGKDKRRFCPYVSGVGFLVKESLGLSNKDCLLPMLYFDNKKYNTAEYIYNDLNRVFKNRFDNKQVIKSVKKAEQEQKKFLNEIYEMGEKFMGQLEARGEKIFFGTGRGYTLLDDKASSKVHELFSNYGMHFIPMLFLRDPEIKINNISENIFWVQGRKVIKNTVRAATNKNMFVVRETNFNCGPDSMLLYHEEEILNKAEKPNLVLQTDGHNCNAQFGTRILANFEVVKKCDPPDKTVNDFTKEVRRIDLKDRLIGFPCMGDSSNAVEYSFRSLGFRTESIPTFTFESREIAKKLVNSSCCRPLSFQVGDIIAWLKNKTKEGVPPEKLAVFQPDSKGPCRFGQYHVLLRKFFNENGFTAVSVINPDSNKDYSNYPLPKWKIVKLVLNIYKGFVAGEILLSMLFRTRPYEKEKGAAEKVYEKQKSKLNELVAANSGVSKIRSFLSKSMPLFEAAMDKAVERKPIVSVNGEIFMRWHPAANQNSIKLLEKYGLEVVLSGVSQWIDYVNKSMAPLYFKQSDWYRYFTAQAKRRVLDSIKKRLYEPVNVFLAGRKEHAPEVLYSAAHDALLFDKLIEGESIMSIGEAYLFSKGDLNDISGIYHIAPFGCMHETAASSQIQSIIQKTKRSSKTPAERIIPFMDAVFGDSELPNLEAEIAAFAEMCKQRKKLK